MKLKTPISKHDILNMKAGDIIYFSGVIYTGRDSAHKKLTEALDQGLELPIDFNGQVSTSLCNQRTRINVHTEDINQIFVPVVCANDKCLNPSDIRIMKIKK